MTDFREGLARAKESLRLSSEYAASGALYFAHVEAEEALKFLNLVLACEACCGEGYTEIDIAPEGLHRSHAVACPKCKGSGRAVDALVGQGGVCAKCNQPKTEGSEVELPPNRTEWVCFGCQEIAAENALADGAASKADWLHDLRRDGL